MMDATDVDRFWSKVDRGTDSDGCWTWTGPTDRDGYGWFKYRGRMVYAHRFSAAMDHYAMPDESIVCHRCDNPPCVRPDHLFLGTIRDNAADMVAKGRSCKGDRHWTRANPDRLHRGPNNTAARLTDADVLAIRADYASGTDTQAQLAARFGVTQSLISKVVRRDIWSHLKE